MWLDKDVYYPCIFNTVLDSVLCKAMDASRGIRINLTSRLEDLDYTDDICRGDGWAIHFETAQ
jgi:hypothetical protein